jgi:hypothetical protein
MGPARLLDEHAEDWLVEPNSQVSEARPGAPDSYDH